MHLNGCIFLFTLCVFGNSFFMKQKDFIEKAKTLILNRVRFHAPIVYDDKIDKRILFENGINPNLPVFKFEKPLNECLLRAFFLAKKEEKFNLLISTNSFENFGKNKLKKIKNKYLKNAENVVIYSQKKSSISFIEIINKLNINYFSSSNFDVNFKEKFFKINNTILNPNYKYYSLRQNLSFDGVYAEYCEFVLNGNNYFCKFKNVSKERKRVSVELNIPLAKGYYYFKKMDKCILIENLLTKKKMFLNYICKNCKFSFSNIDGIENSTFCCVNAKLSIILEAGKEKVIYFNFGDEKFSVKEEQTRFLKELSQRKCCEIFNIQVKTRNPKFDTFFNVTLPKKIWINWLNFEANEILEKKYLALKMMFVKGQRNFSFVNFKEIGLKELGIFNGECYKKIYIVSGKEKFLKVGKTFFYNINGISTISLKSKEPISLSFGE